MAEHRRARILPSHGGARLAQSSPILVAARESVALPSGACSHRWHVAVFSISPIALGIGFLPQRQQRLVEAWAELHSEELLADWQLLQSEIRDTLNRGELRLAIGIAIPRKRRPTMTRWLIAAMGAAARSVLRNQNWFRRAASSTGNGGPRYR
ncbi:MAG: DUF4160 domain-containing protein [Verrucomicrobiales bacterium]